MLMKFDPCYNGTDVLDATFVFALSNIL